MVESPKLFTLTSFSGVSFFMTNFISEVPVEN